MRLTDAIFRTEKSCPRCRGTVLDALQREGVIDNLLGVVRFRPYHCRRCYRKFYLMDPRDQKKKSASPRPRMPR